MPYLSDARSSSRSPTSPYAPSVSCYCVHQSCPCGALVLVQRRRRAVGSFLEVLSTGLGGGSPWSPSWSPLKMCGRYNRWTDKTSAMAKANDVGTTHKKLSKYAAYSLSLVLVGTCGTASHHAIIPIMPEGASTGTETGTETGTKMGGTVGLIDGNNSTLTSTSISKVASAVPSAFVEVSPKAKPDVPVSESSSMLTSLSTPNKPAPASLSTEVSVVAVHKGKPLPKLQSVVVSTEPVDDDEELPDKKNENNWRPRPAFRRRGSSSCGKIRV